MKISWRTELAHWLLLAGMFVFALVAWPAAPARIPVHWNFRGAVDRYGGRFEGLVAIPLVALGIYLLLLFLPRVDPGRANYERFSGAYHTLRLALTAFLAAIYGVILLWLRGVELAISTVVPLLVGVLFVLVGNLLGKVRPNWFVGVRTPWTLSSKLSWTRTHRAAGWLFVVMGLAFMAAGVVRVAWFSIATLVMVLAGVAWLALYSYLVWRGDPDKLPPVGTTPAS
jgi:uncharacterized membrane protein